ncbi:hypothetical protein HQN64_23895 [Enterobacteriaceae bacterium BIT-l23]|uniref:hypothetical protein n=1 Tax=Jejubacter sp. L23 TaxID=3092086 RepID=UPI001584F29A|nr:hypothetical protein [Enterobacteriaceae bacterium BIT-l23]
MRYRYIAILAIIMMFVGVAGIYKSFSPAPKQQNTHDSVEYSYFVATHGIIAGTIVNGSFFMRKTIKLRPGEHPAALAGALNEKSLSEVLTGGAVAITDIAREQAITAKNVKNLPDKINAELIAFPLSVSAESILNPDVGDYGFVNLYLVSNDNSIYREDIYQQDRSGGSGLGKEYKDTRVKKFASNVWMVKRLADRNGKNNTTNLSAVSKGQVLQDQASEIGKIGNELATRIVYAYFNKRDIDSVIQAQVLGTFVVSPVKVNVLRNKLSSIDIDSREVTAADIVSGAPLAVKKPKVIEIRGSGSRQ